MIRAIAQRVVLLWGWRRNLAAFLAGAVGALAMPPFGIAPALIVTFAVGIWLLDGATGARGRRWPALRAAFSAGWWLGFGYFLAGLWWIGGAFLVEAEDFVWLMPFAVVGIPAMLAFFTAVAFVLARCLWPRGATRLLSFAASMAILEWLRGHLFTGFPWNAYGYALAGEAHLGQILSIIGLPGLTLLTVLILASPALLADAREETPWSWRLPVVAVVALLGLFGFGALRLASADPAMVEGIRLRLMQPNLPQEAKFRPELRDEVMARYLELSARPGQDGAGLDQVTHLIWPESAFPFIVSRDADALADIADLLPPDATLLTGAGRMEDPIGDDDTARFYNSVHVVDTSGTILDSYDKVHLVPFGEYLPFQATLEALGFEQLTRQRGGFTPGPRLRTLDIPNAPPAGMLICYEAIFPGETVEPGNRPGWLLNVTNDAWFGRTPGPYQHLLQARARTIEEGLPMVRAANSGVSAVIDPFGRILSSLPLGTAGILDSGLPRALETTIYARIGDSIFILLLFPCILLPLFARLKS